LKIALDEIIFNTNYFISFLICNLLFNLIS